MSYVRPENVESPKAHWRLVDVLVDRGPSDCAYALGTWDDQRRIGFRWNGSATSPIGNPQSRGLPTWTILDPEIYESVIRILPTEKQASARKFLRLGLVFDTVSVSGDRIALFDIRKKVVVGVACEALRHALANTSLTSDDCRMVLDQNRELILSIADPKLARHDFKENRDGLRFIDITLQELADFQTSFDLSALEVATRFRWHT